jgi:hypothetical protein
VGGIRQPSAVQCARSQTGSQCWQTASYPACCITTYRSAWATVGDYRCRSVASRAIFSNAERLELQLINHRAGLEVDNVAECGRPVIVDALARVGLLRPPITLRLMPEAKAASRRGHGEGRDLLLRVEEPVRRSGLAWVWRRQSSDPAEADRPHLGRGPGQAQNAAPG